MNEQKHTIGRQVLELTVTDREQALHIQNNASSLVKSKLIPALDQLFNNLTTGDEVLRIDRLVLDLGDVTESSFDEELVSKVVKELEHQLTEAIHTQKTKQATPSETSARDNGEFVFLSKPDSHLEQLAHYLKYGVLPWWREAGAEKRTSLNKLLQVVGKENKESIAEVILPLIKVEQVRKRIAYQLNAGQFFKLITFFPKKFGGEVEKGIKQLATGKLAKHWEIETTSRYHLLGMISEGKEVHNEDSFEELIFRIIRDGLGGNLSIDQKTFLAAFISHLDAINLSPFSKEKIYSFIIQTAKESNIPVKAKELKIISKSLKLTDKELSRGKKDEQSKPPFGEAEEAVPDAAFQNQEPTDAKTVEPQDRKTTETKDDADAARKKETVAFDKDKYLKSPLPEEDLESQDTSFATSETSNELDQKKFRLAIDQQEVWVNNAGLVLLNPFLFFFFDGLGLLNKGKNFKSDQYAFRAVHLLQYLATGETATAEHELSLNKILCGIDLNDPIPYDLRLTKKEKEECDHLINVVLERWEVLNTKDPEALRNGFMRREGRLSYQGRGWNLFIERTTLDVLLDRLPWSLSMIKLLWRDDIIYVEW